MALLCEYSFDAMGSAGGTFSSGGTVADTSGNGNTLSALTNVSLVTGKTGIGIVGDGSSSLQVSSASAIKPTSAVTWMCWAKVTGNTYGWGQIFGRCNDDTSWGDAFSFYLSGDNSSTYRFTSPIHTTVSGTHNHTDTTMVLTLNTWVHIASTWSTTDGTLRVFINGSEISNVPYGGGESLYYGSGGNTTKHFNVMLNEAYTERANQIQIDDVRVFDTQLNSATITTYMNTPAGGWGSNATLAWLRI